MKKISEYVIDYVWKYTTILTLEPIPPMEPIPASNRLQPQHFFFNGIGGSDSGLKMESQQLYCRRP